MKNMGMSTFRPSSELMLDTKSRCMADQKELDLCNNYYFLFKGYNSPNVNMVNTLILVIIEITKLQFLDQCKGGSYFSPIWWFRKRSTPFSPIIEERKI